MVLKKLLPPIMLLLFGIANAINMKGRMQYNMMMKDFSQVETGQTAKTCATAINIIKKGPADFSRIIGSGMSYSDPDFPAGPDAFYWSQFPRPNGLSSKASIVQWARPS